MAMAIDSNAALVLFSGGQDSSTCLVWALSKFSRVETIGFNYGQRHSVEMKQRPVCIKYPETSSTLGAPLPETSHLAIPSFLD
mmetsp:Transcript_11103/g.34285  ORF Transcript_11103/g.34285 Transcript_11103/m.34285 type:complete len:83 (-) Transcript_11103:1604-1852(-)